MDFVDGGDAVDGRADPEHAFLTLAGEESIDIEGLDTVAVGMNGIAARLTRPDGSVQTIVASLRVDSEQELTYLQNQGVTAYAVRKIVRATRAAA